MPTILNYGTPHARHGWRPGDTIFLTAVATYTLTNVVVVWGFAANKLGPTPLELLGLLGLVAAAGTLVTLPLLLVPGAGSHVTWRSRIPATLCFAGLTAFNFWCLGDAAAAC